MKLIQKLMQNKRLWEMFRFAVTGGVCFVVQWVISVGMESGLHIHYQIATAVGFTVSVVLNYIMCLFWVFDANKKQSPRAIIIFVGSSVAGLFLNMLFVWLIVDLMHIPYPIALVIATLLVMIWNYVLKRWALKADK